MIQITELSLLRGSKLLLQEVNATVYPGHKVGLIGANGSGKSSLFALLRNEIQADQGDCRIPKDWRIVSVAQETPASNASALDYVLDGDKTYRQLQQQLAEAEQHNHGEQIAQLHLQLEQHGAYDIQARAATILAGLGFSTSQLANPVSDFSGGWRMRLNLAQALLCPSDLLLLDEPTNHLDLDAVIWLEKYLQRYPATLILISHDREFLDNTVQQVLALEQQQLTAYTGNYSAYEKQRAERIRLQNLLAAKQQAQVAHMQSFIDRFKAKASKAKQAQSRIKQLEKMETLLPAQVDSQFSFAFYAPPKLPNPLINMQNIKLGYSENVIIEQLQLNLVPGSRIGLLGRNGAGKSTLIKCLAGQLAPLSGDYHCSAGLRIGYFAQHQLETLHPQSSPLEHVQRLDNKATEQSLRDYLGGFGFHGDQAVEPVAPMSGGEKARLVLALIVYQKPNLLLLDEPTNHLDLRMRDALNLALQNFSGAMVLVSHDRFLLSSVCDDFYLVDSGRVSPFNGDLQDYRDWLLSSAQQDKATTQTDGKASQPNKPDRKQLKRLQAEFRQATHSLRKQIDASEKAMHQHAQALQTIREKLADPSLYEADNKAKLQPLLADEAHTQSALEDAEANWLDAQENLEQQQQTFDAQFSS